MTYECSFDFTVCKPNKSQFIGKSGIIELTTDREFTGEEIEELKQSADLQQGIAKDLASNLKQKNIFSVTVKEIKLI